VGIEKQIHRKKKRLGMSREKNVENRHRSKNRKEQSRKAQGCMKLEDKINHEPKQTSPSVVDGPDGHEVIPGFALVRISTAGTPVQGRKPIPKATHPPHALKERGFSAGRAPETQGTPHVRKK
jgi:hypothetical protein